MDDDLTEPKKPGCDICGHILIERNRKLVCPRCGFMRDCSDP